MTRCFSLSEAVHGYYRSGFIKSGLRPVSTVLNDGTTVHCWVPKTRPDSKPNLLLIHGLGATAVWQWSAVVRRLSPHFNIFVPDLLFFGGSFTTRPDRSESFQAQCLMGLMEALSVRRFSLVGLSYGGFVGYRMAALDGGSAVVEKVVICCAAVCMEEKDLKDGVFRVSDLDEAARILVPESVGKLRELMSYILHNPSPSRFIPSCLLKDFIEHALRKEYVEEKRELIKAIPKDRKISEIPKITQPTLIIWGEKDHVFPVEMGKRLEKHLSPNGKLVVIKKTGHIFNFEKPKTFLKLLKSFLIDPQIPIANEGTKTTLKR